MIAHSIFFYIFAYVAIVAAIMVTVSKNTVHSVFFLILDFISVSCLFIMIGAEFLGMMMLIVYVGAVAVLFLFVVMMLNVAQQNNPLINSGENPSHIPVPADRYIPVPAYMRCGEGIFPCVCALCQLCD